MTKQDVIKTLTSIKGIGEAKAKALYDAGFTTLDKIRDAPMEDLTTVDGISETIASLIQKHLTNLTSQKEVKTPVKKPSPVSEREKKSTKPSSPPMEKEEPSKKSQQRPQVKKEEPKDTEPEDLEAETEAYVVKKKPTLPEELKEKLRIRTQVKQRTPTFLREEWFRYKRIPQNWRRPDGLHSKMRVNLKYRPSRVRVGFRGPKETRGLHPSGFEEIMVYTVNDLDSINPETQAARIGGTVGSKKRQAIIEKAKERDIRLLNK